METIISLTTVGLSILVPLLFVRLILRVDSPDSDQSRIKLFFTLGIMSWSLLIWASGYFGWFSYQEGDDVPRFLIPLFIPLLILTGSLGSGSFRNVLDQIEVNQLVGFQFWRIFGAVFFLVAISGSGPRALLASGYGDVLSGTLAIIAYALLKQNHAWSKYAVWGFMLVGITDLLAVLYILLVNYPIWSDSLPSSSGAGSYPLIYIVGIVAPIALFGHILILRKFLSDRSLILYVKNNKNQ